VNITVYGLDVPLDPAGRLTQAYGTRPGQRRQQLPSLLRQHLEQQRRRLEADEFPLGLPLEGAQQAAIGFLAG
jgi:hypothetical protein